MNGSFHTKGGKRFTIEMGDKISVFPEDEAGLPILSKRYDFYSYDSIEKIDSLSSSIDSTYKNVLANCHKVMPIKEVCLPLGLYLTKDNRMCEIIKTANGYSISYVSMNFEKINSAIVIKNLEKGQEANIYGFKIKPSIWKACLNNDKLLDSMLLPEKEKNIYLMLLSEARNIRGKSAKRYQENGFVSQIFLMAIAGFSAGVVFMLILSVIKHYM